MKFSPQQQIAFDKIMAFATESDDNRFVLGGFAGTGKSTISKSIADEFDTVIHVAYTGKAANVLREKGNKRVSTIHGALYKKIGDEKDEPKFALDEESILKTADLVIVDEYSMLPEEIIQDIEGMANKVLYLGDPFQLPPVHGECSISPDYFLEEIHRQALDSPILRAATDVREGRSLSFSDDPEFKYGDRSKFCSDDYDEADQIIVGYNKTRAKWNERFREKLGFAGEKLPQRGDKIICTRNNHDIGLFNGMIGEANSQGAQCSFQEFKFDFEVDGVIYKSLPSWDGTFKGRKECIGKNKLLNQFDFGYAITCHKSQGSEFDNVLIYNEPIGKTEEERRRWLYTAITRGKNCVKLVEPPKGFYR